MIASPVRVETLEAVDQIEEIAAVPGIDGIFVGPADLAAALGHVGDPSHPEVKEVATAAVSRILAAGKPAGFLSVDEAFAQKVTDQGARFVARDIDMAVLKRGLTSRLQ